MSECFLDVDVDVVEVFKELMDWLSVFPSDLGVLVELGPMSQLSVSLVEVFRFLHVKDSISSVAFDAENWVYLLLQILLLEVVMIVRFLGLYSSRLFKFKNLSLSR